MTKIKAPQMPRAKRVGKSDWLAEALAVLAENGIESVRVESLAARLGVAKSGFYYHFRDRKDLFEALLSYWIALDHAPQRALDNRPEASAEDQLSIVAETVDSANLSRFDVAIRQWARTDPSVRRVWRQEMNKRLTVLREMLGVLGFTGDDLEMRVRLFAAYQITERDLFSDLSREDRKRLRQLRLDLILSR